MCRVSFWAGQKCCQVRGVASARSFGADMDASVAVIAHHATPGKHTLTCEVMQETSDPNGGHEFRLIAVDAS